MSDVYQDLFHEGSYVGKGIYDVDAFEAALDGRVPENALLSHDLFEGLYARAGLCTDIDVVDAAAMQPGYQVQLVPAEYASGSVFATLTDWLDRHMRRFGFFRPYSSDRGGAGIEPWHLSYAPVAVGALEALSLPVLREAVAASVMAGKAAVLERLPEIYTRFILATDPPPGATGHRGKPGLA